MYLYAFIAILVPALFDIVTPILPLCTGVSQMNFPMAQTQSQNQTLHGCVAYNWSYGHFVIFWPILGKVWLPWQRPLDLAIRNVFFGLDDHENPLLLVIAFSLSLVEMHLCAFIAIFVPKLVVVATPLWPLCTAVSQINSPMPQTLSQTKLCMDMWLTTEWPFLWFFGLFWPKFGCHGNAP